MILFEEKEIPQRESSSGGRALIPWTSAVCVFAPEELAQPLGQQTARTDEAGHRSQRSVPSPASGGDQRRRGLAPHAQLHMSACCAPSGCALQGADPRPDVCTLRLNDVRAVPNRPLAADARSQHLVRHLADTRPSKPVCMSASTRTPGGRVPVSYTHLTLPTNREV